MKDIEDLMRTLLRPEGIYAYARWDTGPWLSSPQGEGTLFGDADGLVAAENGMCAEFPWHEIDNYRLIEEERILAISAGAPSFWFFALELESPQRRDKWIQLLESRAIPRH